MTGAGGYLGAVLTEHFVAAGHEVRALTRSEAARERVAGLGARAVPGSLADTGLLRDAAAQADAVVHAAVDYAHPSMREVEEPALAAMLDGAAPGGAFVYTSTGLVYPDSGGAELAEDTPVRAADSPQPYKVLGEEQVLAAPGPAATVVRAGLVYGRGGSALPLAMIAGARQRGAAVYVGTGANLWSVVHVDDLARLYLAAVERAERGLVVNAAARPHLPMREIAEAVADLTGARALSLPPEQAHTALGPFAAVLSRSAPMNPSRAETALGWKPVEPSLPDELRSGSYTTP